MNVLILGATGMLGYSLFSNLADYAELTVKGTVRSIKGKQAFFEKYQDKLLLGIDVTDIASIERAIIEAKPDVVINCIGLIKQHDIAKQHVAAIEINALLPHQLAALCDQYNARLIHFSTDCVFDGKQGMYHEADLPNATDLYGKSKCLGEVNYGRHLTLRTSIIGHELDSAASLVDWFLSQRGAVNGFSKAVFSGLPTC
ncbi:dTDP-4-dehydrorhamnose reductase family protein [Shewanella algae]|uniref:dTDP-4-dehydrorhamnose reductase family protein n=1 Tax=Shewanella algae TaxID=38313 RepID=UPI002158B8B0|nr:SDR family oxidoreductase [Shewanella algae]